jgi:hypothetical protein
MSRLAMHPLAAILLREEAGGRNDVSGSEFQFGAAVTSFYTHLL